MGSDPVFGGLQNYQCRLCASRVKQAAYFAANCPTISSFLKIDGSSRSAHGHPNPMVSSARRNICTKIMTLYVMGVGKGDFHNRKESPKPSNEASDICAGYFANTDLRTSILGFSVQHGGYIWQRSTPCLGITRVHVT